MTPPPDLRSLDLPEKDALIVALIARIDAIFRDSIIETCSATHVVTEFG